MKKIVIVASVLLSVSSFSQNLIPINNVYNFNNQAVQSQNVQVLASNIRANTNKINNPVRVNANQQAIVQRASNSNTVQRRQVRRVVTNTSPNIAVNPVQINADNVSENNINNPVQLQVNFSQQSEHNTGNAFGNENMIEQIASANIPAIQLGSGSLNLNIDMPALKLPSIKLSSRKSSASSSKHRTFRLKKKMAKLNRNMTGKFAFGKKLKIKVDNCFKW